MRVMLLAMVLAWGAIGAQNAAADDRARTPVHHGMPAVRLAESPDSRRAPTVAPADPACSVVVRPAEPAMPCTTCEASRYAKRGNAAQKYGGSYRPGLLSGSVARDVANYARPYDYRTQLDYPWYFGCCERLKRFAAGAPAASGSRPIFPDEQVPSASSALPAPPQSADDP